MAFFEGTIYSRTLHMDTQLGVILPQDSRPHHEGALKNGLTPRKIPRTVILLHGLTDSASVWWRRTSIERYAEEYDIAVIMPEVYKSFYQDMEYGEHYFSYITEELPQLCKDLFQISMNPEDLMIAGLSMGGYGALRCALTYPERYYACGAFSSGCDIQAMVKHPGKELEMGPARGFDRSAKAIFGENLDIPDNSDLFWLADHLGDQAGQVKLYMTCGRQDPLYEANQRLKNVLAASNLGEFHYEDWDGNHEWGYWDVAIQRFFEIFCR